MKRRIYILLFATLSYCTSAFSQAVGTWQTYFSYSQVDKLAEGSECVYAISNGNLFALDKEYESLKTYTKIQGMSDNDITDIQFNKSLNTLLIVYADCNIDLLKNGSFLNIPDLKRKSINNKRINSISFRDQIAYLSCGFGIVAVNMGKQEIADTYIIGPNGTYTNIYATAILKDSIFALAKEGIYAASLSNTNLADYANWKAIQVPDGAIGDQLVNFNDDLLILRNGKPCRYNNGNWTNLIETGDYTKINASGKTLTCFGAEGYATFNNDWVILEQRALLGINDMISNDHKHWIAHCEEADCSLTQWEDGEMINQFKPDGPYTSSVAFAKMRHGKIITGSGGPFDRSMNTPGVVQVYENGKWTIIQNQDVQEVMPGPELFDVLDAEFDPADPRRFYVASWRGLFEFYDNKVVATYNAQNSLLEKFGDGDQLVLVDGLFFDQKNNLWMTNMMAKDLLKVKKADGTWESLYYSEATNKGTTNNLLIDSHGLKWVLSPRSGAGVFVSYDNKTPFYTQDDQARWFNQFNEYSQSEGVTAISTSIYRCIAEDKNGAIWIGTEKGPLIINNPEKVFSENFYVERIKITREDNPLFADYLLANEQVESICVDGANRKWIGTTTSGLFLLSEDGQETIHHFTKDNSPLTSNYIVDISINEKTGEVLIATANGLFSYMSDAIEGSDSYNDVYAYPNPVKENYDGPIIIKGLMENSIVKIADIEGNVVHQGISNGGIFSWDGKRLNGKRVKTGIYLVFMALSDGSEKAVTKIAVIN
ncbi:MAG: hypothetical protein J6Y37_09225 [Paludibacteraceae bacterium]|nr:hypothetical protein [Paludibacteraceae bacterium]